MKALLHLLAALTFLAVASVAVAQQTTLDLDAFESVAERAQTALSEDRLSTGALETLRSELADWRARIVPQETVNDAEIDAINAQINALGPAPAEGESEAADIAQRREELQAALAEARAPEIAADEAYARADALIGRLDERLRSRQADAFFQLDRSPLLPSVWAEGWGQIKALGRDVAGEVRLRLSSSSERAQLGDRAPLAVLLLIVAMVLILRGARWIERLTRWVEARSGEQGRVIWGFLVSLGAILLPLLGISLINSAIIVIGVLGSTGEALALGINAGIIAYFVSRWLGSRVFPERDQIPAPISLDEVARARGRLLSRWLGVAIGILICLRILAEIEDFNRAELAVPTFPVLLGLGWLLFRMGRILLGDRAMSEDESGYAFAFEKLLGRALVAVGVAGPILAAIGYFNVATGILLPSAMTLAIAGFIASLHVAIRAGFARATGLGSDEAEEALIPVLVTFVLTLAALPVLALVWGMRPTDLAELWTRFQTGFRLGETRVSPGDFLTIAIVFVVGLVLTKLLQGTLRSSVLPRTRLDKGGQNALVSGLGYVGFTLAALAAITAAGIDLSNLAIVIGALGVGIGFGLQNIVNNFVSGIILLIERPIGEGDWVEVNGATGFVKAISVRSTRIETFDKTDVIVPNGDLISGTVTNWTRGNSIGRVIVPVGVAYGTDTKRVEEILREIAKAHPLVTVNPEPHVLFMGFGADSLDFEIRAILTDVKFLVFVRSDMNHEIARRFAEEGIEIPFAQRDLWLRNPEVLRELSGGRPDGPRQGPRPEPREIEDTQGDGEDGPH